MTTRDALLAAVIASPEDDLPRLVFADYLEENGEPEWAEFIRTQCRDGYVPDWADGQPRTPAGDGSHFTTREQLLHRHLMPGLRVVGWDKGRLVCYTPAALWPTVARVDVLFDRGFASEVWCNLNHWLEFGPGLVRCHPVERVFLERVVREVQGESLVSAVSRLHAGPLWPLIAANPRYKSDLTDLSVMLVDEAAELEKVVSECAIQWAKSVTATA